MILDKKIKIKIRTKKEVNKYNKFSSIGDIINIDIKELSKGSHRLVKVKCDNCGKIKEIPFYSYNKITKNGVEKYYCNNKECINIKRKKSLNKKYGIDNVFQLESVKKKSKETCLEKYNVENPHQNKKIIEKAEQTNLKKYGFKNVFQNEKIKEKSIKTRLKTIGVEYPQQNKNCKEKSKQTNLKKYGVEYPSQRIDIFNERMKKSLQIKKYKNTDLYYQASYEKDFLDKYYGKMKIENGFSIKYKMNGKNHIYHPDFYLPEFNLVIEIKSEYWFNKHKEKCLIKEKYTKKDYNYILIMNKDYNNFELITKIS